MNTAPIPTEPEEEFTAQLDFMDLTPELFARLPRTASALTLMTFDEDTASLLAVVQRGEKLPPERITELMPMVEAGDVFIESTEFVHLRNWVVEEPDLLLLLDNMPEAEKTLAQAVTTYLHGAMEHFTRQKCDALRHALSVLTEMVTTKRLTPAKLCAGLTKGKVTLAQQSYNSLLFGLATFMELFGERCTRQQLDDFALGLALHDLGMTRIPGFVLDKETELQKMEWDRIREHPEAGAMMISMLGHRGKETLASVDFHHERADGSGYPKGLAGDNIPVVARITALADSLAAMIAPKSYRPARPLVDCLHELARDTTHYDRRISKRMLSFVLTEME